MIKQTTANRHVEIFPKLERATLNLFESKLFLGSESDPSKLPRVITARSRSVLTTKNSLMYRIHITRKTNPCTA